MKKCHTLIWLVLLNIMVICGSQTLLPAIMEDGGVVWYIKLILNLTGLKLYA